MENLIFYNAVKEVPETAKKKITGGRLSGMTDINPMWRIKALTELFGPVGLGWKVNPETVKYWLEPVGNGEVKAFCSLTLQIKYEGEWSEPIPGIGGSSFVSNERGGLYASDECYKMAYTDAFSVACKQLGIGADVYWNRDATKYTKPEAKQEVKPAAATPAKSLPEIPDIASVRKKLADEGIKEEALCKLYKVEVLEGLTPKKIENIFENWEKVKVSCTAEAAAPASLEEAFGRKADLGNYKGFSLGDIYKVNPENLVWLINRGSKETEAARFIVLQDPELSKKL